MVRNIEKEFEDFAKTWGFVHTTTSPHYPQSNGLAEKTVQIAKSILTKTKMDKKDPYLSLLEYRNIPVDNFKSPAQLLMSRRLRSILPTTNKPLLPKTLRTGQPVRIQERGLWKPAVIVHPANTERSYHVCTLDGQVYRRNRRQLLSTKEETVEPCGSANIEEEQNSNDSVASLSLF
ncbi:putative protein K02A2.6-like protein [Labeo rohita]|uniref:Integrase catalytic domain-containing protein n=1 Tax=Labeo rohita TaxID=84645 RepID=A0A498M2S6_LABRO|nr:putative protein K02A2.6-like protein [Labeo rohita]